MKTFAVSIAVLFIWTACGDGNQPIIDREALVERNSPVVTAFDSLASLSVGNGEFAYTVDITGLQTFPDNYKKGVPLGTQSQWGWQPVPYLSILNSVRFFCYPKLPPFSVER